MEWLILLLILVLAVALAPDIPGPDHKAPQLPTVSQSRKVPLVFGKALIKGPNVLEARPYRTKKIREGNSFTGKRTVGYEYFQDMEMGIAWASNTGDAILYQIRGGEYKAWTGNAIDDTTIILNNRRLFGKREGGLVGRVSYIKGTSAGHIIGTLERGTKRLQPGYPGLSRCFFGRIRSRGFYWGNSATYKPISFIYGNFPNPLSADDYKIGDQANPAYCLYELHQDSRFGLGTSQHIDSHAITTMAATLFAEGLGISRAWYDGTAFDVEREILQLVDGIRYRSKEDGKIIYKLIRNDFDLTTVPNLNDDNIINLKIKGDALTNTATRVAIEYIDIEAEFKTIKVSASNTAARLGIGRAITTDLQYWGAGTSTNAQKIASREALKRTRPRRQGDIICDREAWDYLPGDTITITSSEYGFINLPVRVVEHSKGKLTDGRVRFSWIEEIFEFGKTIFTNPDTSQENFQQPPENVINFLLEEDPWFLAGDSNIPRLRIAAEDPSASLYYDFIDASVSPNPHNFGDFDFSSPYQIKTAADENDTTIVVEGFTDYSTRSTSEAFLLNDKGGDFLCFVETATGIEIFGFTNLEYDEHNDETLLTGCIRGLIDTYPKPISALDRIWFVEDMVAVDGTAPTTRSYRFLPTTPRGTLPYNDAIERTLSYTARHNRPAPAGNIRFNGVRFPASITGPLNIEWNHRNRDEQISKGLLKFTDAISQTLPTGVTYTTTIFNHDTGATLQTHANQIDEIDTWDDPGANYNIRVRVETKQPGNDARETFEFIAPFTQSGSGTGA